MLCNQMNNTVLSYFYGWRAGEVLWMHAMQFMDLFWISWMHACLWMHACTSLHQRCYGWCFGWCTTSSVVLLGFMDEHA